MSGIIWVSSHPELELVESDGRTNGEGPMVRGDGWSHLCIRLFWINGDISTRFLSHHCS